MENREAAKSVSRTVNKETAAAPVATRSRGRARGRGSRGGARGKSKKDTETSPIDVSTTSRSSRAVTQTKKPAQTTLQSYIASSSSQSQPRGHNVIFLDDSDSD